MAKHYNHLSLAEKEKHNRPLEPPTRCPKCDLAIHPDDLLAHVADRCEGRPEPHPRSRWVTWGEALQLGLRKSRLGALATIGEIRTRQRAGKKRYLKRDVVRCIASKGGAMPQERPEHKKPRQVKDPPEPLTARTLQCLIALTTLAGSNRSAAKLLGISLRTVRRAVQGKALTRETRQAIAAGIGNLLEGMSE